MENVAVEKQQKNLVDDGEQMAEQRQSGVVNGKSYLGQLKRESPEKTWHIKKINVKKILINVKK